MSETWFTADLHLGHANIIRYCQRPFLSPAESEREVAGTGGSISAETVRRHDDSILSAINERVSREDTLWILGDFSLSAIGEATRYRESIRCRHVHLVRGNHDQPSYDALFERVMEQGMVKVNGKKIWLNHYPMRSWDKAYHGSWHLYGHVHGRLQAEDAKNETYLARDVGIDTTDYVPLSFSEVEAYMKPREEAFWKWKRSLEERG